MTDTTTVGDGTMPEAHQQGIELDLDGLVARYGRKLAQAELEAEVAVQRANRLERAAQELAERLAALEADADPEAIIEAATEGADDERG